MNVQDKYQDVLTLEASVQELYQMFQDFALLVDQQGELLDQIEHQVQAASEYIDDGNKDMVQAIELQKSIRKKQCCCIVTILVVIGIIVGIVFASQSVSFFKLINHLSQNHVKLLINITFVNFTG